MKIKKIAFAVSLALSGTAVYAEAGRILAVAGDVTALRGAQEIKLALGAPVENGDTLKVGEGSTAQIRFVDESVVSLRANSLFKIENYSFAKDPENDKSIFGLIKGGMRTITGLIGKQNKKNYAITGATATIGIRGTHFTLVVCESDCKNGDGSVAPQGLYGGVTDGRIAVVNDAGDFEFGQQEFFRLESRTVSPERLLAPPSFISAGFEAAARSRSKGTGPANVVHQDIDESAENAASIQTSNSPQPTTVPSRGDRLAQQYEEL